MSHPTDKLFGLAYHIVFQAAVAASEWTFFFYFRYLLLQMFNEFWEYFRVILYTACHYHGFQRVSFQSMGIVSPIILTVKRGLRHVWGGAKSGAGLRYILSTPASIQTYFWRICAFLKVIHEFIDVFVVKDEWVDAPFARRRQLGWRGNASRQSTGRRLGQGGQLLEQQEGQQTLRPSSTR